MNFLLVKCSPNCARCSRSNTCDLCSSGFGFFRGECTTCPSATHILSNGFCLGNFQLKSFCLNWILKERHPENCAVWSGPEECTFCMEGFGMLSGKCQICPEETHFLSNGQCEGKEIFNKNSLKLTLFLLVKCPDNCKQCTQPNLCDSCNDGFGFFNNACVTCPADTHFLNNGFCIRKFLYWHICINYLS